MMTIRLGIGLDLDVVDGESPSFGEVIVGFSGMLSLLESQLGLAGGDASLTTRLVQYHHCLKDNLSLKPFYANSFQADPFASTKTLLSWRDELYLSGWTGIFKTDIPPRLKDLEVVEKQAKGFVAKGEGERLQQVIERLDEQSVQIEELILIDPLAMLPPLWQQLIAVLKAQHGVSTLEVEPIQKGCKDNCDLGLLQNSLLDSLEQGNSSNDKVKLSGDDSLIVVKAGATAFSASAIAKLLHPAHEKERGNRCCLLAEQNGSSLDAAMEQEGLLRLGFRANSPWRPAFQVLPLSFELLWQPLDPHILLQFLNHPVGPLPRRIRKSLSRIVASQPGIGGESWQDKIREILNEEAESDPKQAKKLKEQIDYWLHSQRYKPEEGMPSKVAIKLVEQLSTWLKGMLISFEGKAEAFLYRAALKQLQELLVIFGELQQSGMVLIDRESLRHLVEGVRGSGTGLVDRIAEVGHDYPYIQKAESASAVLSARETIIWWDCHKQGGVPKSHWLAVEKKALVEAGLHLWSEESQLTLLGQSWLRPVLRATKQLIFVLHEASGAHHPVLDNIESLVEGVQVVSLEEKFLTNKPLPVGKNRAPISTEAVEYLPLPLMSRWWQLPAEYSLPKREWESYSSLETFINSPYQWVMRYQAQLKPGAISTVSDQNLLKGSLAHRLFEIFLGENANPLEIDVKNINKWADETLITLLEKEGAVLLMPGRLAECEKFKGETIKALETLVDILQKAEVTRVEMESWQEGSFVGGKLNGSIDLLTINSQGQEAVVDIKWGGFKYRHESLENDQYLQLGTYAKLRKEKTGRWPVLSYFIIQDARLLSNNRNYFAEAEFVEPKSTESVPAFWQRAESSWKWRRAQLDEGRIEVTIKQTEPTELSQEGNEDGLAIPESSDRFSDFSVLTGWRRES